MPEHTKVTVADEELKGGGAIIEEEKPKRAPRVHPEVHPEGPVNLVPVKVIQSNGAVALVEWVIGTAEQPDWKRAYVPCSVVTPQGVAEDDLAAGEPYGVKWESYMHLIADKAAFARALRQAGIWTVSDMSTRPTDAQAAINQAYQVSLRTIIIGAKKER